MKKIFNIACGSLLALSMSMLSSCGDNKDYSSLHTLSDAELAEMARQDSILKAQRESINADLILEYSTDITISSTSYDGSSVTVDMQQIADLFGVSLDDLLTALDPSASSDLEIGGFAINGTTHADEGTMSNTNAAWGHWWDANGDVTTWGESAMVFAEFNPETSAFAVGQYPGHLTDGQTVTFYEGLKYQDKRAVVKITVTAQARGEVAATVVNVQSVTLTTTPKSTYDAETVEGINYDQILSDLGVSSFDDVSWIAVNADGSYAQEYTADAPGFWFNKDGGAGSWGDDASVYCGYYDNVVMVGQFPDHNEAGTSLTIYFGAMAGNKIEMLEITINFQEYEDPETAPEGTPESIEKTITITKPYTDDYANVQYDVQEDLRNAFKMTTYQIFKAVKSGDLKVYLNEVSEEDPKYTGEAPGYWIDGDGNSIEWKNGIVWMSLGSSETELYLYGGNHPDNCSPTGQSVPIKFIIVCNGVTATYNITFDVTAKEG